MGQNTAVQLKIVLKNSKPVIWRRVLVDSSISFYDLHYTIQISMGWGIFHAYEFNLNDYRIGIIDDELEDYGFGSDEIISDKEISLQEVISQGIKKFTYEYDFGDSWIHSIEIEKIVPLKPDFYYPVCIKGSMNCPPEDCGGIAGYYNILEIISDRNHPEHEEIMEWIGGGYDPMEFDLEETNLFLREIKEIMDEEEDDNY